MNYYKDDNNYNSTIDTLLSYYKSNNSKIRELNTTNSLIQKEIASLMSRIPYQLSILTNISESEYSDIAKYINKTIKRGDEKYKSTKTLYDCIMSELHTISKDIETIKEVVMRCGYGYRTIAINLVFDIGDNEFELRVPMPQKITVDDIFYQDYIDMDVNKFQLYIHSSTVSWTRIWVGEDISKIPNEILKGDNNA